MLAISYVKAINYLSFSEVTKLRVLILIRSYCISELLLNCDFKDHMLKNIEVSQRILPSQHLGKDKATQNPLAFFIFSILKNTTKFKENYLKCQIPIILLGGLISSSVLINFNSVLTN